MYKKCFAPLFTLFFLILYSGIAFAADPLVDLSQDNPIDIRSLRYILSNQSGTYTLRFNPDLMYIDNDPAIIPVSTGNITFGAMNKLPFCYDCINIDNVTSVPLMIADALNNIAVKTMTSTANREWSIIDISAVNSLSLKNMRFDEFHRVVDGVASLATDTQYGLIGGDTIRNINDLTGSVFSNNIIDASSLTLNAGIIGAQNVAMIGAIKETIFDNNTVLVTKGGIAGAGIVGGDTIGSIGSLESTIFSQNVINVQDTGALIDGAGLIGGRIISGAGGIGSIKKSVFYDNSVAVAGDLIGAGLIGGNALDSLGAISDTIFHSNVIEADSVAGAGLVGGNVIQSITGISKSYFYYNQIIVHGDIDGAGLVGGSTINSLGTISGTIFSNNAVTAGSLGSIFGGGLIGSRIAGSVGGITLSISDSKFVRNDISAADELYGGLIYIDQLASGGMRIHNSIFSDNTFVAGTTVYGGAISINTASDNATVNLSAAGQQAITQFANNRITANSVISYNSISFHDLGTGIGTGNATLNIDSSTYNSADTSYNSKIELIDPIKVDISTDFNMNVIGAGDFSWGGVNNINAANSTFTFKSGSNTTFLADFELNNVGAGIMNLVTESNSTINIMGAASIDTGDDVDFGVGTLNFHVAIGQSEFTPMLTVANNIDITNTKIRIVVPYNNDTGETIPDDALFMLMRSVGGTITGLGDADSVPVRIPVHLGFKILNFKFDFYVDNVTNTDLMAQLSNVSEGDAEQEYPSVNPQSKALSEGWLGGMAILNHGSDFSASFGISSARGRVDNYGATAFSGVSGSSSRYETGSHVDSDGMAIIAGLATKQRATFGNTLFGGFAEAGISSYETYNSFTDYATINGKGDASYIGGGLLLRLAITEKRKAEEDFYTEASVRVGQIKNEFTGKGFEYLASGPVVNYESSPLYYGGHIGLGFIWDIADNFKVDTYAKYFYTVIDSDEVEITTDETIVFDKTTSMRARAGMRFSGGQKVRWYLDGSYEQEYAGESNAYIDGIAIDSPSLKGNTSRGELGIDALITPEILVGGSVAVYDGLRSGIGGSLKVTRVFSTYSNVGSHGAVRKQRVNTDIEIW